MLLCGARSRAVEWLEGTVARAMPIDTERFQRFPADQSVRRGEYRWSTRWQRAQRRAVRGSVAHVLLESASPLFGDPLARSVRGELREQRCAGVRVARLFDGSDIRLPSRQRARSVWSLFGPGGWNQTAVYERVAAENAALAASAGLPVFVSTPDLLIDLPDAQWLPVVVDPACWHTERPPLGVRNRPMVVHIPNRSIVKSTDIVQPVLGRLSAEGVIDYRLVTGVSNDQMVAAYGDADIAIDQLRFGTYGVAACEAMAAGRIVVSHVDADARREVRDRTGREVPIVEATGDILERVLREVVADPEAAFSIAANGPGFVAALHDGRRSAELLRSFLRAD